VVSLCGTESVLLLGSALGKVAFSGDSVVSVTMIVSKIDSIRGGVFGACVTEVATVVVVVVVVGVVVVELVVVKLQNGRGDHCLFD